MFGSLLWSTCFQEGSIENFKHQSLQMTMQSPTHMKCFCAGSLSILAGNLQCSNIPTKGKTLDLQLLLKHNKTNNNEKMKHLSGKPYWERYLTLSQVSLGNSGIMRTQPCLLVFWVLLGSLYSPSNCPMKYGLGYHEQIWSLRWFQLFHGECCREREWSWEDQLGDSSVVQVRHDSIMDLLRAVLVEGRYQSLDIFWWWNK